VDAFGDPTSQFSMTTGDSGMLVVDWAMAPAIWNLFFLEPWSCGYDTSPIDGYVYQGQVYYDGGSYYGNEWWKYEAQQVYMPNYYNSITGYTATCYSPTGHISPASTRFAILGNLPNTLSLGSETPLITQYGMPLLYVYDKTGSVVDTETATSVSSDGTQATFPFPSSLQQNGYSLALVNKTGGGVGFAPAGDNLLSIATSQTIQGNPFGVAALVSSTTWQSASNPDPYGDGTCAGQWSYDSGTYTNSVPVVTQYSLNSVNIGGVTIPVGSNPTAITLFGYQDISFDPNSGPCSSYSRDTTQMTRAIVTNSGGNTVSILNLVNNTVLSTVSVGNQPVALALSSDGNTAYVANYTDGTVTRVNLTTETATGTIAVGAHPTSVALTSAGTLWVGGVGSLAGINTQTMSVIATQPLTGKSIVALGFSNSVNQLVATTVDTSGNVYADEISPSTVQTGSVYTPLASNKVSSIGTHSAHSASVQAFTATLASTNLISANQVGAPPLVIQDGWAVVTATPTGFTITDITGKIVLVSETTPSPVTAIAVDSGLNVVYLVMPDSNTLLTVPLPGINQTN